MAATIAVAQGHDGGRIKRTTRLGSRAAEAHANTWHTFARVYTDADGSVIVSVRRDGREFTATFTTEDQPLALTYLRTVPLVEGAESE